MINALRLPKNKGKDERSPNNAITRFLESNLPECYSEARSKERERSVDAPQLLGKDERDFVNSVSCLCSAANIYLKLVLNIFYQIPLFCNGFYK